MRESDALNAWYDSFGSFVWKYDGMFFSELDYYCTRNLNLYAVYEQPDFAEIKLAAEKIGAALPSVARIFSKPIIHLIEEEEILPVESIRYINNKSLDHVASHSELWADVNEEGIKPRKLLSRTYKDNYSIYENVVFANTVDLVLGYLRAKVRLLDDMMFSQKLHNVNILDRTNHLDYYIVLGKLHTGYIRNFGRYTDEAGALKDTLVKYYHKISGRLYKKVYRANRDKRVAKLYKTNILSMDKDYRKIYNLYRFFDACKNDAIAKQLTFDNPNYFWFCEILLLFSLQHFGFAEEERQTLRFDALDLSVAAKNYRLNVRKVGEWESRGFLLTFVNHRTYTILLLPVCKYDKNPKTSVDFGADEVVFLSPVPSDGARLVGITELDSFRRLWQILLKGMVMSSTSFEVCPFCLGAMKKDGEKERYVCDACKQVVEKLVCPEKQLPYYHTYIDRFIRAKNPKEIVEPEARLNFRNINRLTPSAYLCPHCKKVH